MRHSLEHLLQARIFCSPDCLWKAACSGWIESRLWISAVFNALEQTAAGCSSSLHCIVAVFKQRRVQTPERLQGYAQEPLGPDVWHGISASPLPLDLAELV